MGKSLLVVPLVAVIGFILVYNYNFLSRIGRHAEDGQSMHIHDSHMPHVLGSSSAAPSSSSASNLVELGRGQQSSQVRAQAAAAANNAQQAVAAQGGAEATQVQVVQPQLTMADHLSSIRIDQCAPQKNVEYWGQVAGWGAGNKRETALDCCRACREQAITYVEDGTGHQCNAWVWCGELRQCGDAYQDCWLKQVDDPYHPPIQNEGPSVPWTSGVLTMNLPPHPPPAPPPPPRPPVKDRPKGTGVHTVVTCNGSPYVNFQMRIHYATYLAMKKMPGAEHMRHFTRILHRKKPDALMGEVPTVRVDPLHPACDTWCEFPVHDRPDAFAKWLDTKDSEKGEYILLIETDYVWIKPMPIPLGGIVKPLAYHYDYINPFYPGLPKQMKKWYNGPTEDIPCTGPAPILATPEQWRILTPTWERITAEIEADPSAKKTLGWVREMYAYSLAAAVEGIPHDVQQRGKTVLITQPPADEENGNASLYHYTWGLQLKYSRRDKNGQAGKVFWEWDKRKYMSAEQSFRVPQIPMPPAPDAVLSMGLEQQFPTTKPATRQLIETISHMIGTMNAASRDLPALKPCGWSGYPPCQGQGEISISAARMG
mmetsp:Transcript_39561/g.126221  ORF Transcript_39561/g.126221 Transcript_39561/m.126221 type:complete len:597 (+) Transcript_39561:2730-4520(+)